MQVMSSLVMDAHLMIKSDGWSDIDQQYTEYSQVLTSFAKLLPQLEMFGNTPVKSEEAEN